MRPDISIFNQLTQLIDNNTKPFIVSIVGKYTDIDDTYLSIVRSLEHASFYTKKKIKINWINSSLLDEYSANKTFNTLSKSHGVIIPGGFGNRGI